MLLTGARGSKAGRPVLNRRSAYSQVIKHVFVRLDASEAYNWCFDGLLRFPNKLQSNGFNGGAGQTPPCVVGGGGSPVGGPGPFPVGGCPLLGGVPRLFRGEREHTHLWQHQRAIYPTRG